MATTLIPAEITPTAPSQPNDKSNTPERSPGELTSGVHPALVYSPWVKVCKKGKKPSEKEICFITASSRFDTGAPAMMAMLVEIEGEPNKFLRITLPLGMQLPAGTRLSIDQNPPMDAPYILCDNNGCMADFAASNKLIQTLKTSQRLLVTAVNRQGQTVGFVLPLGDFAIALENPPVDQSTFEEQQRTFLDDLHSSSPKKQ